MSKPTATQTAWNAPPPLRQAHERPAVIQTSEALSWWCQLGRAELKQAIAENLPRMQAAKVNTRIYKVGHE